MCVFQRCRAPHVGVCEAARARWGRGTSCYVRVGDRGETQGFFCPFALGGLRGKPAKQISTDAGVLPLKISPEAGTSSPLRLSSEGEKKRPNKLLDELKIKMKTCFYAISAFTPA